MKPENMDPEKLAVLMMLLSIKDEHGDTLGDKFLRKANNKLKEEKLIEYIELNSTLDEHGHTLAGKILDIINDKLNELLPPDLECCFQVGFSSTRDSKNGSSMDLRTVNHPLDSASKAAKQIRIALALLQKEGIISFEEKINHDSNKIVFVITHVAPNKFFQTLNEQFHFPKYDPEKFKVQSTTIRTGNHGLKISYVKVWVEEVSGPIVKVNNKLDLQKDQEPTNLIYLNVIEKIENLSLEPKYENNNSMSEEEVLKKVGDLSSKKEAITVLDLVATQAKPVVDKVCQLLNKYCDIPDNNGFSLCFNSNSIEYPIDFRLVCNPKDEKTKIIISRFSGIVARYENVQFEIKPINDNTEILILKHIHIGDIQARLLSKNNQKDHADQGTVQKALDLFKKSFPQNGIIKDFYLNDGQMSSRMPFPHIRTQKFWPESRLQDLIEGTLKPLIDNKAIDWFNRPETNTSENAASNYKPNSGTYVKVYVGGQAEVEKISEPKGQLIIEVKSIEKLKEKLVTMKENKVGLFNTDSKGSYPRSFTNSNNMKSNTDSNEMKSNTDDRHDRSSCNQS